jgi:hypothetical protein
VCLAHFIVYSFDPQVQLPFAAAVSLLEGFAGLSDHASLATILAGISPRSLLLLGSGGSSIADMAAVCASKLNKEQTRVLESGEDAGLIIFLSDKRARLSRFVIAVLHQVCLWCWLC